VPALCNDTRSFTAQYGLPAAWKYVIVVFPIIIFIGFAIAMYPESTQDYAFALVEDNSVVDALTFVPAFAGGIVALFVANRLRWRGREKLLWMFYLALGLGLIFIGGEETSWGQNFFHYHTPEIFQRWNEQGEVTLHNVDGLNDRNHFLRLAFGAGGLIGLLMWKSARFRDLAPPRALAIWFWLIALKSALDIFTTSRAGTSMNAYIIAQLSEVIEMLIAIAGLLYLWLNLRRMKRLDDRLA
jgi:hypothetical protein